MIKFNISRFTRGKMYLTQKIEPYQVLPLRIKVDLGATAMKVYSPFPKAPGLKPHHQII